jgi:hypothetical protein
MYRFQTSTKMDDHQERIRVRIESDPCEKGSLLAREYKMSLLHNLAANPSLLQCGDQDFQTMKMFHNGDRWLIEAEALVDRR